ncbi:MAG: GNAT family N-acetyltransferase [Abditibacteriota bacterium]|nr:GNAT family N-acetyltransferase [Abditibacteriota bacterium]
MVYLLEDTSKAVRLFDGMQDSLIESCLQKVMGRIWVTDPEEPASAFAFLGCFGFLAGEPSPELLRSRPEGFAILIPGSDAWARLIEAECPEAKKVTRYAIRQGARFDRASLSQNLQLLPKGYELRRIDGALYDLCLASPGTEDFVGNFDDREHFLREGRGMVIVRDGEIVSGASSYSRYREGIEVEVWTAARERRKHLALVCCSALILLCLDDGLYPRWDAANLASVGLAGKLGYEFDHEYPVYEVL